MFDYTMVNDRLIGFIAKVYIIKKINNENLHLLFKKQQHNLVAENNSSD